VGKIKAKRKKLKESIKKKSETKRKTRKEEELNFFKRALGRW
jgi:hypothetical protein